MDIQELAEFIKSGVSPEDLNTLVALISENASKQQEAGSSPSAPSWQAPSWGKAFGKGGKGGGRNSGKGKDKGPLGPQSLFAKWKSLLDEKAAYALLQVGKEGALEILEEMDKKKGIRNPSAYVSRACEKRGIDVNGPITADDGWDKPITLDDRAKEYLASVPPEEAQNIMAELAAKGNMVRNHSAYVMKAVVNARKDGKVPAPLIAEALDPDEMGCDEKAKQALSEIPHEAAQAILQELAGKIDQVRNVSAFVLKAVGNARKGMGAGGKKVAQEKNFEILAKISELGVELDERAVQCLEDAPPTTALRIVELMAKHGANNPSAYIMTAIAKEKLMTGQKKVRREMGI